MSDTVVPDKDELERTYEFVLARRDFEVNQLVQRNNFFMVFQGVLLAGLAQASGAEHLPPIIAFVVCVVGMGVSFFQLRMAAGAKFWQERWEQEVDKAEATMFPSSDAASAGRRLFNLLDSTPREIVRMRLARPEERDRPFVKWMVNLKPSPSGIPIWTGLFFTITWFVLWLFTFRLPFLPMPQLSWITGFGHG